MDSDSDFDIYGEAPSAVAQPIDAAVADEVVPVAQDAEEFGGLDDAAAYKVLIGNLNWWTSEEHIAEALEAVGTAKDFVFKQNPKNGMSEGEAICTIESSKERAELIQLVNEIAIDGITLSCKEYVDSPGKQYSFPVMYTEEDAPIPAEVQKATHDRTVPKYVPEPKPVERPNEKEMRRVKERDMYRKRDAYNDDYDRGYERDSYRRRDDYDRRNDDYDRRRDYSRRYNDYGRGRRR